MKRPNHQDFASCLELKMDREHILALTRRCAAEFPIYIGSIIESIILNDNNEHSIQVLNKGTLSAYPDYAILHMTCKVGSDALDRPVINKLPEFIESTLASRIRQNALLSTALVKQDELLQLQSMMAFPERVTFGQADNILRNGSSVEPYIQLN